MALWTSYSEHRMVRRNSCKSVLSSTTSITGFPVDSCIGFPALSVYPIFSWIFLVSLSVVSVVSSFLIKSASFPKCLYPFLKVTVNVLPLLSMLFTCMVAPCILISSFVKCMPTPVPGCLERFCFSELENLSKIELILSLLIPIPSSETWRIKLSFVSEVLTVIDLFENVNLKAFESKLLRIVSSFSLSAHKIAPCEWSSTEKWMWRSSANG